MLDIQLKEVYQEMQSSTKNNCIDLSAAKNASDLLYTLSIQLEVGEYQNSEIEINIGDIELNSSQVLSIKTLADSVKTTIKKIATTNLTSELSIISSDIEVINPDKQLAYTKAVVDNPIKEIKKDIPTQEKPKQTEIKIKKNIENKREYIETPSPKETKTFYTEQTLRSGQTISFDGNVVLIGDAHPGSEIIASGDIIIWGVLEGIAHAGATGNDKAIVRALKIDAIQLRISGYYSRKPDINKTAFVEKPSSFKPEIASVENDEIVIETYNN